MFYPDWAYSWCKWKGYDTEKKRDQAFENLANKAQDYWVYRKGTDVK